MVPPFIYVCLRTILLPESYHAGKKITRTDKLAKLSIEPVVFELRLDTLLDDIHRYKQAFRRPRIKANFRRFLAKHPPGHNFDFFEAENIF